MKTMNEKKFKAFVYGYMCNAEVDNLSELKDYFKRALQLCKIHRESAIIESKDFRFCISVESDKSLRINWGKKEMNCYKQIETGVKRMTAKNVELLSDMGVKAFAEIYKEFTGKTIE